MAQTLRITASRDTAQRGTTTVELALVLPILISLVLGSIEIANILRVQMTLDNAATTVAREVSVDPTVRTQAAAETYMLDNGLLPDVTQKNQGATDPILTLTPENPTCSLSETCSPFTLKIAYTYHAVVTPFMEPFFDGLALSASVKRTVEPGTGTSLVTE
jgi:Flp pilus assembly protein TadG